MVPACVSGAKNLTFSPETGQPGSPRSRRACGTPAPPAGASRKSRRRRCTGRPRTRAARPWEDFPTLRPRRWGVPSQRRCRSGWGLRLISPETCVRIASSYGEQQAESSRKIWCVRMCVYARRDCCASRQRNTNRKRAAETGDKGAPIAPRRYLLAVPRAHDSSSYHGMNSGPNIHAMHASCKAGSVVSVYLRTQETASEAGALWRCPRTTTLSQTGCLYLVLCVQRINGDASSPADNRTFHIACLPCSTTTPLQVRWRCLSSPDTPFLPTAASFLVAKSQNSARV